MIQKSYQTLLIILLVLFTFSCSGEQNKEPAVEESIQLKLPDDGLEISDAWARPGQVNGVSAIYMNILNGSTLSDTLLSISSPVAQMVEVHETYEQEEGMMGMRPAETIHVPARGSVSLKPRGLHVMLMQLNEELKEGDQIEFTVQFAQHGEISLTAPVETMRR